MTIPPRILILTMAHGEAEFAACKASTAAQTYVGTADHVFFENEGNIAAHTALYRRIMDEAAADRFDLFIKLDADMIWLADDALTRIAQAWATHNTPDHMVFAVHDAIPDRLSMGLHVFGKRCRWPALAAGGSIGDPLFVDPNPVYPGRGMKFWGPPAPLASHAAMAGASQARHFGFHRGLKAFQKGRLCPRPQAFEAFRTLMAVYRGGIARPARCRRWPRFRGPRPRGKAQRH